uniref:RING-type domain-containing protein n=2 Tax=Opuntia streptacantha TaxID=393608 RepID=A0A7C9EL45_OPUST
MLVALCEEAVETLSSMNHPEGDCPLCLYPLVPEGDPTISLPFMKLMSCFHCFHCECIMRWLTWIQKQNETNCGTSSSMSSAIAEENEQVSDVREMMGGSTGNCPVCRKVFLAKDIEHVLNIVDSRGINPDVDERELSEKILQCDLEKSRRQKFEAILELQQQRGGLIEPPKDNVLFSRLSLQELVQEADLAANGEAVEQQNGDQTTRNEELEPSGTSNQTHEATSQRQTSHNGSMRPASSGSSARSYAGQRRHSGVRGRGRGNSRPHAMQWTRKQ